MSPIIIGEDDWWIIAALPASTHRVPPTETIGKPEHVGKHEPSAGQAPAMTEALILKLTRGLKKGGAQIWHANCVSPFVGFMPGRMQMFIRESTSIIDAYFQESYASESRWRDTIKLELSRLLDDLSLSEHPICEVNAIFWSN